jgi:4-aminobutyrate aminotransferase/(S)-3-amino-2-methylpropionate transaminase
VEEARRRGVLLLKAGIYNHIIRFLAPLTTTDAQWQEALAVIEEALQASSETLSRGVASGYHGEG